MASVEALWTAEFDTVAGWRNGGVIVLETNRAFGGDGQYYYVGKYLLNPAKGELTGELTVTHYTGQALTAWGDATPKLNVTLWGKVDEARIEGLLIRPGYPNLAFRLVKREELP
jgi:hypothetical protein